MNYDKPIKTCQLFLTLWEILFRRLYFVRQSNSQVIPLISPGGINYEVHSVGFRVAFARDRSLPTRERSSSSHPARNKERGTKKPQAYVAKGSRLFRESVCRGQLSSWNFTAKTTRNSSLRRHRVSVPRAVPSTRRASSSSSWAIQEAKRRPVDGVIIVI